MRNPQTQEILAELDKILRDRPPPTLDEINALLFEITNRRNRAAKADFCGLSSESMNRFISFPYESPGFLDFPTKLADSTFESRISFLFTSIVSAIGENGLKTTVTGNLPRSVVQSIAAHLHTERDVELLRLYGTIRSETNIPDLNVTRLISGLSGMIRTTNGRFFVTSGCRQLLKRSGMAEIYPRLFKAYVSKFNWKYPYQFPMSDFIQNSFAFTLYLLHVYGDEWRPASFYEDTYLNAFPRVVERWSNYVETNLEEEIRMAYTHLCFQEFGGLFGFIDSKSEGPGFLSRITAVKKTPLLNQLVRFNIPTSG